MVLENVFILLPKIRHTPNPMFQYDDLKSALFRALLRRLLTSPDGETERVKKNESEENKQEGCVCPSFLPSNVSPPSTFDREKETPRLKPHFSTDWSKVSSNAPRRATFSLLRILSKSSIDKSITHRIHLATSIC